MQTLRTVTALVAMAAAAEMAEEKVIGPPENNPYMDYTTPSMSVNSFALPIKNPNECFGSNFEIFDQLTSPEW